MKLKHLAIAFLACACAANAEAPPGRVSHALHPPAGPSARESNPSAAAVALFVNSNLDSARALASAALRQNPNDIGALFVEMEAAALEADTAAELEAALRLCAAPAAAGDPRATIAAARVLDLAGNTRQFRAAVSRIQRLVAADIPQANFLRAALVAAAADGLPGLSPLELARQSGLLTNWRLVGPFGAYPSVAFDRGFGPERDAMAQASYDGHAVESFRFDDGNFNLPDYFSTAGVFYASTSIEIGAAGEFRLRAETSGTVEIWVDGVSALRKDDRFRAAPEIAWSTLRLSAGTHRVLVKFVPSAAPFRIALLPLRATKRIAPAPPLAAAEADYVKAAERYWLGDYQSAIERLTAARQTQPSAAVDFLLAQAWSHDAQDFPQYAELLSSALKAAPLAVAAEYELAARAFNAERLEEAFTRVRRVVAARPSFEPAQDLLAKVAMRLNWDDMALQAFEAQLPLHPSCGVLRQAAKFFASISAYDRAAQIETQLDGCAPGALAYAESLSEAGRHAQSAAAAAKLLTARPLDREARALLVSELLLAGRPGDAKRAAEDLARLAPNSSHYQRLAADLAGGALVLDHMTPRGRDFAGDQPFYAPYRRSGTEFIQKTAARRFSGGPAVTILYDRVAQLGPDGAVALYVHKVTRVLNRDGIEKYGEAAVPRTADLLELRTIKADGAIAEPEFRHEKNTISMPALAPGDAIEMEYVLRYAGGGIAAHPDAFTYTFGSFSAPILYARFAVLSPASGESLQIGGTPDAPKPNLTVANGWNSRVWEQENITQSVEEVAAPRTDVLPTVRVIAREPGSWEGLRDFYRAESIDASRIGPRVEAAAQPLRGATDEATARNLYRMVTTRLRSTDGSFQAGEVASAESTLANYSGSRTSALLALARAAGLDAELLLARDLGQPRSSAPSRDVYTHPLVLFRLPHKEVVADAEGDGLGFGVLPPTIAHEDALTVPLAETAAQRRAVFAAVPPSAGDEHSVADADVTLDPQGNLSARMEIRMGASRSAQMRSILSGIQTSDRNHFFEQLAMRIFPGTTSASGEVRNESDPERPLELSITCSVPHFLELRANTVDMEQLAPALGLRKMYGLAPRRTPLYIDTPLDETAVFHMHLPAGLALTERAADLRVNNEFGSYSVEFRRRGDSEVEIRRAFRIPVQVIAPERFDGFARFARQVDDAERQRLSLARLPAPAMARGN